MKIIISNIRIFIKKESFIFVILILCIFLSSNVLCFSYGIFVNYQTEKQEMELDMNSLTAYLQNDYESNHLLTKEMLKNYLFSLSDDTKKSANCFYCTAQLIPIENLKEQGYTDYKTAFRFRITDNKIGISEITKENWVEHGAILSGRYITDEEESMGENVAVVGASDTGDWDAISLSLKSSDNTIILGDKEYTVIGCSKAPFLPIVPFDSISDSTVILDFEINFSNNITTSIYHDLVDTAARELGDYLIYEKIDIPNNNNKYLINNLIFISVAIAILSVLNFTIPYKYILSKRSRALAIFRMNGCTITKAIWLLLVEALVITIPTFIISIVVYNKLMKNILTKIFPYIEKAYSIGIYIAITGIYLIIFIIMLMALLHKFVCKDINFLVKET